VLLLTGLSLVVFMVWALAQPATTWVRAREMADATLGSIRQLGAGWFFAAYAVLPAFGFPVSVFALSAGPVFGPVLGLPLVLVLAGLCMAVNMTISYVLARRFLRPWVTRLLKYLGYSIPVVALEKHRMFTVLVRVTPGPPYVLQSFLLGLIEVPYWIYMMISWPIVTALAALVIMFGDAVAQGRGRVALLAIFGVGVLAVLIRWVRKRFTERANGVGVVTKDDA
jgi:uncharacterized membrane protein YdjX (TVP38/TMEM64 family)